ncbi:exocyst complex component 3-like isoform X1 [Scleropages formosus]|nr:exocyst complex component 3-like isoform X1 [Scleropages formosus]
MGNSSSQGGTRRGSSPVLTRSIQLNEPLQQPLLMQAIQDNDTPEDPGTLPSVMEINNLIESKRLKEAHQYLLSFRHEVEIEKKGEGTPSTQQNNKMKDLRLLYSALRDKMKNVVKDSSNQTSCSSDLLLQVVQIIQEEEKREGSPGSAGWNWRDTWKEAVREGVRDKIKSVPLDTKEQKKSWLAVHLGLLRKTTMEDLENVKNHLKASYPPSFNVLNTYVESYHESIAQHLKDIPQKDLEAKDCYALLDWIVNCYESEKMMGSPTLQLDVSIGSMSLSLGDSFLNQIKDKCCDLIRDEFDTMMKNLIEMECEKTWGCKEPETMPTHYHSEIHCHICLTMNGYIKNVQEIDPELSKRVLCVCLETLKPFPHRLRQAFDQWYSSTHKDGFDLQASLHRTACINSCISIKEHLETYRESSPQQVEQLGQEMDEGVDQLGKTMMEQFQKDIEPFFKKLMTQRWLTKKNDFYHILRRMKELSQLCKGMKPPYVQTFVNKAHYHVVWSYVSQLMNSNYTCKNKYKRAAAQIKAELRELQNIFTELNSNLNWLSPLGDHLFNIIEKEKPQDIKTSLQDLVKDYPDISGNHVAAVLRFQGMGCRQKYAILNHFNELKNGTTDTADQNGGLFNKIHVPRSDLFCCLPVS